jgi:glyoxylase-like metal-dependent hydrolase (beta-lactamase superfamily II)
VNVVSEAQFKAWNESRIAPIEELRDGIWAVPLPLGIHRLPWVFSYFIFDSGGDLHLVDAGWDSEPSWEALTNALSQLDASLAQIRSVTVTHFHPDHLGMAARIRSASGARVALLDREQEMLDTLQDPELLKREHDRDMNEWGVPSEARAELHAPQATGAVIESFDADVVLADGDLLDIPGRQVRAIATPGHTYGELSLHDQNAGILYSGDHLLPNQFPGIGLGGDGPTNPIRDYFGALDRVAALGDIEVNPGHGWRFTGLQGRVEETREHHLTRSREIAAIIGRVPSASVWEVASMVTWTLGWDNLRTMERLSALRQTAQHIDYLKSS